MTTNGPKIHLLIPLKQVINGITHKAKCQRAFTAKQENKPMALADYPNPRYPQANNQRVTGGYGNGQIGTVTFTLHDRLLVRWDDGSSTWQARWLLKTI